MKSNSEIVDAFRWSKKASAKNMYTDGTTIWSYGFHFPMAHKINWNVVLYNVDTYSVSTSTHQALVRRVIQQSDFELVIDVNTDILKGVVGRRDYDPPIRLPHHEFHPQHSHIDQVWELLRDKLHDVGLKRVPLKKWKDEVLLKMTFSALQS